MATFQQGLALLSQPNISPLLNQINRGIEKEGLRATRTGEISQTPHPKALGSALTHPFITTDYSESLLEFITPVSQSAHEVLAQLEVAHRFAYENLDGELIWPSSMPCILDGEMSIPIANYGTSNLGKLKHVYRRGLWHRYGRTMQSIAGIHYNFSLPDALWHHLQKLEGDTGSLQDFISKRYFGLIRNFRRHSWLMLYLFGASPAVCDSFLKGKEHKLETLHKHTLYAPYATSLRMSDFGYQNNAQSSLMVCYNKLDTYIETLGHAVSDSIPAYEAIGIKDEQGEYKQINTNLLQIENEYYSDIRPKRVAKNGEKPLEALANYGVEYIEVRSTDINSLLPVGIDVPQMKFMDMFLIWCLLNRSDTIERNECDAIRYNQKITAMQGRLPNLILKRGETEAGLQSWGLEVLAELEGIAALMDAVSNSSFYGDSLNQQRIKLVDVERTPSAQVLRGLKETGLEFAQYTLEQAKQHRKVLTQGLADSVREQWKAWSEKSLAAQQQLEEADDVPFDQYLAQYLKR